LRYAESLSQVYLGVKIPKSTLHYWEVRHGDAVEDVLKALFRLLSLMDHDYSVVARASKSTLLSASTLAPPDP
jgi:hypothetical protein